MRVRTLGLLQQLSIITELSDNDFGKLSEVITHYQ